MEAVTTPPRAEGLRKTLLTCAATATLALFLGAAGVRIWKLDLRVPFTYSHDAFPVLMWTKSVVDTGWWMTNDHLGAPGRMEMADYPTNPNPARPGAVQHGVLLPAVSGFRGGHALCPAASGPGGRLVGSAPRIRATTAGRAAGNAGGESCRACRGPAAQARGSRVMIPCIGKALAMQLSDRSLHRSSSLC
jgi:hypothetical protein